MGWRVFFLSKLFPRCCRIIDCQNIILLFETSKTMIWVLHQSYFMLSFSLQPSLCYTWSVSLSCQQFVIVVNWNHVHWLVFPRSFKLTCIKAYQQSCNWFFDLMLWFTLLCLSFVTNNTLCALCSHKHPSEWADISLFLAANIVITSRYSGCDWSWTLPPSPSQGNGHENKIIKYWHKFHIFGNERFYYIF